MRASFDIVVSAENSYYHSWQAMLFHYSCVTKMGCAPIIVVHGDSGQLVDGFRLIEEKGGRVQTAHNFRRVGGFDCAPRNTVGTLSCVASDADYLVLCDPDMIFVRPLPLAQYQITADQISFDSVSYLVLNEDNLAEVAAASRRANIALESLRKTPISGGVPHIVPASLRERVASEWMRAVDCFVPAERPASGQAVPNLPWLASMWALVFVVHRLGLNAVITQFCLSNFDGRKELAPCGPAAPSMLHYCYGDAEFEKRSFFDVTHARELVWQQQAPAGTVNGTLCAELRAAALYFGLT